MKKLLKYICISVSVTVLAACTKDPDSGIDTPPEPTQDVQVSVYAVQQQGPRASVESVPGSDFSAVWQYGDNIGLFVNDMWHNVESNAAFEIDNVKQGQTTARGRFSALAKDTSGVFVYYAYYPFSASNIDARNIVSALPYVQNAQNSGPDASANFMIAEPLVVSGVNPIGYDASYSIVELSMKRAFALLNVSFDNLPAGETVEYVTIRSLEGKTIAGEFSVDITDLERYEEDRIVVEGDFHEASSAVRVNASASKDNVWVVMAPQLASDGDYAVRVVTAASGVAQGVLYGFDIQAAGIYAETVSLDRMRHFLLFEDFGVCALETDEDMENYSGFSRAGTAAAGVEYSSGAARIQSDKTGDGAYLEIDAGDMFVLRKMNVKDRSRMAVTFSHKGGAARLSISSDGNTWRDAGTVEASSQWTDSEITLPEMSVEEMWIKFMPETASVSVDNVGVLDFGQNISTLRLDSDSICVDNTVTGHAVEVFADRDFRVSTSAEWITLDRSDFPAGDNVTVEIGLSENSGQLRCAELYFVTTDNTCSDTLRIWQMGRPFFTEHELLSFVFEKKNNPQLKGDVALSVEELSVDGRIPYITDVKNLVPSFTSSTMSRVSIDGQELTSGVTPVDFTKKVLCSVVAENGDSSQYEISVVHFTGLPILYINTATGNPVASKDNWEAATIYLDGGQNFDGYPLGEIYIKGRGNSSWGTFVKKQSYNIKLPERSKMLGMPKHKRWSLIGNYRDKTLLRNQVSMELGNKTQLAWVPRGVQVELVLNGTHRGTYLFNEQIRIDKNRVDINEMLPTDTDSESITGGYVMEWDQYGDSDVYAFRSQYVTGTLTGGSLSKINVKIPNIEDGNSAQFSYIENHFRQAEEAVCNNGGNFSLAYEKYIDINSFADFWMVYEISATPEPARGPYSLYMYKDKDDSRFYAGPLWDFDFLSYVPSTATSWVNKSAAWYRYLFTDPEFMAVVKNRWNLFKDGFYEVLNSYIDEQQEYLRLSAEENWALYDLAERSENGDEHISSDAAIQRMKIVLKQRLDWMDRQINSWTSNTASGNPDSLEKDESDKNKDGFWE